MRKRPSDGEGETSSRERCPEVMNLLLELWCLPCSSQMRCRTSLIFPLAHRSSSRLNSLPSISTFEQIHGLA